MRTEVCSSVAIQNVAVATDFAPCTERALQHAIAAARHFAATLHFVHFVRPSQYVYAPEMIPGADEMINRDFERLMARLGSDHRLDDLRVRRWIFEGEVSEVAGPFVEEHRIDLLVLGTHGRAGLPRLLFGSVAQEIFQYVRCPVLTVGPFAPGTGPQLQLRRVLFSTDLSQESLAALPYVLTVVRDWQAELDVLHVCSSRSHLCGGRMEELSAKIDELRMHDPAATIRYHVLTGDPAASVVTFAEHNHENLVILGLKPQRALYAGPSWSHAYEIVRQTPCPVLSVRSATLR